MRAVVLHFQAGGDSSSLGLLLLLFPHLAAVRVETVTRVQNGVLISARSRNTEALCGSCGTPSRRVHSRYRRQLQDMTCGEVPVTIELEMRRWFCVNSACLVRTFAEQVPELARPYARRTPAPAR